MHCFKIMSKIILDTWLIKKFSFASFSYKDDVIENDVCADVSIFMVNAF